MMRKKYRIHISDHSDRTIRLERKKFESYIYKESALLTREAFAEHDYPNPDRFKTDMLAQDFS